MSQEAGVDLGGREDLVHRLSQLARDKAAPAMILVTHHLEEVPPGFTHAMLLRDAGSGGLRPHRRGTDRVRT